MPSANLKSQRRLNFWSLFLRYKSLSSTNYIKVRLPYLPTPPLGQDMTQGQFFKRSLTGLNSEFSFSYTSCLTKAEELSLSYYLPIAGGRITGSIPFPRVLVLCEMQSVSSRIWTRVAVSSSYDDNHYTTGTSKFVYSYKNWVFWNLINSAITYYKSDKNKWRLTKHSQYHSKALQTW